ncbi:MAG: type II secretion system protein [Proteobacteria bacterium]|nr:type II secretion system protein [Pseudomonadota bacterium]
MLSKIRHIGMTLIELMTVIAIIALLAGIMINFVSGSREVNAQVDLSNDVETLFQAQRVRATSMNVATYIIFHGGNEVTSIEPRIGGSSICSPNDIERYPIRYTLNGDDNVAIDIKNDNNKTRTLDSTESNKYIYNTRPLTKASATLRNMNNNAVEGGDGKNDIVICFQPNGQAAFFAGNSMLDAAMLVVDIKHVNIDSNYYSVEVTGLGSIRTYQQAN